MIHITPLRTRRLSIRLREIAIEDAIKLASITTGKTELETSEFLRFTVQEATTPTDKHVTDPRAWTVQERMFVVCHYLATVSPEGPNFTVGDKATYSDYLMPGTDYPRVEIIDCGVIGESAWQMRPMLGAQAEAIESLQFERPDAAYFHWFTGAMAAQLLKSDETAPDPIKSVPEYRDWLRDRIAWFGRLPESEYAELTRVWIAGQDQLKHFFQIDFNSNGALALPVGGSADSLPAARFRASACCSEIARRLCGKPARDGV